MCGTATPTKPIGPQKAVILPASKLVLKKTTKRQNLIFKPNDLAEFSPNNKAFNALIEKNDNKTPIKIHGKRIYNCEVVTPDKLPIVHIIKVFKRLSLLKYCRILTNAPVAEANIIPRIKIVITSFTLTDTAIISKITNAEPNQAEITIAHELIEKNKIEVETPEKPITKRATPKLAPELIPKT